MSAKWLPQTRTKKSKPSSTATRCAVTTGAPEWLVDPVYPHILTQETAFDKINAECPLTCAPGLLETLKFPTPPSLEFFRSLPSPPVEPVWGLYLMLLEKPGCDARLYGGSGTRYSGGVQVRLRDYDKQELLPRLVKHYLALGYKITHRGLVCWCPIPSEFTSGTVRVRMIALEATLGYIFATVPESSVDDIWGDLWPWDRSLVTWKPLCTHTAFNERPKGTHDMTEEEFVSFNEERRRINKIKANERSVSHRAKTRAQDLRGYLDRTLQNRMAWQQRNPERVLEIAASVRARNLASKKFFCETCQQALQSSHALKKHQDSKLHKEQVRLAAGGKPKTVSAEVLKSRDRVAKHKLSKQHYCVICDMAFNIKGHLNRHLKSAKHAKKSALAEAST